MRCRRGRNFEGGGTMILAKGRLYEHSQQLDVLKRMPGELEQTRTLPPVAANVVIRALDELAHRIEAGVFSQRVSALGIAPEQVAQAVCMLRRENVEYRLRMELGTLPFAPYHLAPPTEEGRRTVRLYPLGVLMHVAAGNAQGLPVLSLAEGLMTGNINILKLPQADNGLSVDIICELLRIEPGLTDYIYVFDTPSSDVDAMQKMAQCSDGIVVWGGDEAVAAVRRLAPVGAKLIEWGHRLSFAYISGYENKQEELACLARHIVQTRQLLCSSCQVIYLDTQEMGQIHAFCEEFLPVLDAAARQGPQEDIGTRAQITLRRYTAELEQAAFGPENSERHVYQGSHCQLIACEDNSLELSDMFGRCLVKRLPAGRMASVLCAEKGKLQTVGLICEANKRAVLAEELARCGLVRITRAGEMSRSLCGEAHDGEYPLRRYLRVVETDV